MQTLTSVDSEKTSWGHPVTLFQLEFSQRKRQPLSNMNVVLKCIFEKESLSLIWRVTREVIGANKGYFGTKVKGLSLSQRVCTSSCVSSFRWRQYIFTMSLSLSHGQCELLMTDFCCRTVLCRKGEGSSPLLVDGEQRGGKNDEEDACVSIFFHITSLFYLCLEPFPPSTWTSLLTCYRLTLRVANSNYSDPLSWKAWEHVSGEKGAVLSQFLTLVQNCSQHYSPVV